MTEGAIRRAASGAALAILVGLASCARTPGPEPAPHPNTRRLVVWMLSDIQPRDLEERRDLERAVADVDEHVRSVDIAIIAGDLLQSGSTADDFDWFDETLAHSRVAHWYGIAGNHDARNARLFETRIPDRSPRAVTIGNLRLLLLSDESRDSQTEISDEAFQWWRDQVTTHRAEILVTVTHGQLSGSGLLASFVSSRTIERSERFEDVLAEHPVALWASGHTHLPQGFPYTVHVAPELGGTTFVNVSAIRDDVIGDSQSRFLVLVNGSQEMRLRSRNHTESNFSGSDVVIPLEHAFQWDGAPPRELP